MALGTYNLTVNGNDIEVEVARESNVEYPVLQVPTGNGWGYLPVVDEEDADTPIEVPVNGDWKGIRRTAQRIIDDFERGNIDPYTGSPQAYADDDRSSQGNYALRIMNGYGTQTVASYPGDGLEYYPERGDTIEFDVFFSSIDSVVRVGFFADDGGPLLQNEYQIHFQMDQGTMTLFDNTNGDLDRLGQTSVDYDDGTWKTCRIGTDEFGTSVHYPGGTISTTDTSRSSGGIVFSTTDNRVWFDNIRAK